MEYWEDLKGGGVIDNKGAEPTMTRWSIKSSMLRSFAIRLQQLHHPIHIPLYFHSNLVSNSNTFAADAAILFILKVSLFFQRENTNISILFF